MKSENQEILSLQLESLKHTLDSLLKQYDSLEQKIYFFQRMCLIFSLAIPSIYISSNNQELGYLITAITAVFWAESVYLIYILRPIDIPLPGVTFNELGASVESQYTENLAGMTVYAIDAYREKIIDLQKATVNLSQQFKNSSVYLSFALFLIATVFVGYLTLLFFYAI